MAGLTNLARNYLVDALMRQQAMVVPAEIWVALCSTQPTAGAAGTEFTGTGYGRVQLDPSLTNWSSTQNNTSVSNGTTGTTKNLAMIDYGVAGSNWGLAGYWEFWDAETGGNRWLWGEITDGNGTPSPRSVVLNDPVSFPIGALSVQFS